MKILQSVLLIDFSIVNRTYAQDNSLKLRIDTLFLVWNHSQKPGMAVYAFEN